MSENQGDVTRVHWLPAGERGRIGLFGARRRRGGPVVTCTTCGEHNRDGAKFCVECGASLAPLCTNCGEELGPEAKFCDECGCATSATRAAAPTNADGAVRKTVTVMFADLVGSTAFGEAVDAESARHEMAACHRLSREVIERHDGTLVKFIGDGVMAVFGVPDIAEDDADRAVRAGLDLQREFREIADRIETRYDLAVELRIGINSGEIVIAEDDDDMVGDAINTAARIEAQCTPGRVLVGEQTWRLTRSAVDYEALEEVRVKGKEEPVSTFQVIATAEDEEVATPFVGRRDELATLTAALEATIDDGTPRLVTVIGSPGVGKTRLAAELASRATRVSTFDLRVDRAGAATFEPIADLLRGVVDLPDGLDADDAAQRLSVFVGESDDRDRLVPLLASFVGAAPLRSTQESLWAARRLVELLTAERPAVIVVDDIQWSEPLFLDLLEHLIEWVNGPVFLVALARPEIRELRPAFAEVGRRISEVVSLEGLDAATTEALAAGILGTDRLPAGLAARLPDSTQGNPLFVRELMRMLVDDGTIAQTPTGWALSIDVDAVEVPPTIMSLLASRVERMDDDERRVVEMAGVVGSEFARGAVAALLPDLGGAQLDRILERLRRQEVLDATGNYWGDEPMWRFHHVLIRDAAYRRLLKERRAELHRHVAEWTEAASARIGGEHEIAVAFHYEQAHEYLGQLGPHDADGIALGVRAAELLTIAATRALDQDDLAAAGTLARRALDRLEADDPRRPEILLVGCEAFFSSARVRDGESMLVELRGLGADDRRLAAWAESFDGQYIVLNQPGRLAEAEPRVAAAADVLAELDDNAGVAKARLVKALVLARQGRVGDAEVELDQALFAARSVEDRRRITAVLGAAPLAAVWGPSPVARAGGRCLDIIRLLRITSASPMVEATSVRCQAVLEAMRGRFDESRHLIALAAATVEELGLRHGVLETAMYAGYIELLAGEPAAAEPHLRAAFAGLGSLGVGADAGQAAAHLARAIFAQGRVDEAAEIADRSDALAGQGLQALISSRAVRAEIAAARGETDEALRLATEAVDIAALTDLTIDHADAARSLAAVHRAAGRTSEAATAESSATRLYESKGARPALFDTMTRAEGDPDAPRALRNRASAAGAAFVSALYDDRDLEGALSHMADDFVGDDRRALIGATVTKTSIGENYREQLEHDGELAWRSEVLATAGDNLALGRFTNVRSGTEFETAFLSVVEIDQTGRVIATVAFEPDDFDAAIDEIQRRYLTGEGDAFHDMVGLAIATQRAINDADAMRALLADDFVVGDHRTMSFDDTDAEGYLEIIASFGETFGNRSAFTRQILALSDSAMLVELSLAGAGFEWSALSLLVRRGDHICRAEVFDENDVDRALTRYKELATQAETHRDELRNRATRFITEHRDELESTGADSASFALTTVATRGNNICVSAATAEPATLGSAAEHSVDSYHLVEVDDEGHLVRLSVFAADDLQALIFEMHDWFIAGEGAPHAEVLRTVADFTAATLTGDLELARSFLAADFRVADHGTMSLPMMGRDEFIDQWAESVGSVDGGGTMFMRSLLRLDEGGLVGRGIHTSTSPDGFAAEWGFIIVQVLRRGELWRTESFPEDQLDAALSRFDELISQGTLHNRASDAVWVSTSALYGRRDIEGAMSLVGDGYRFEDRRALRSGNGPLSVDELVETYFTEVIEYDGEIRWEFEVVATRGEGHAVIRQTFSREGSSFGGEVIEVIEVATVDSDGLLVSEIVFDPAELRAAQDEMNEQYVEGEGAAFRDVIELAWAFGKASEQSGQEWERVGRALVAPDFEMVDHSPIGFPTMDSDTAIAAGQGLVTDRLTIVSQYYRIHARALLLRKTDHGRNQSGGAVAWDHIVLLAVRDGQVFRIEQFSVDQLEAANTRFDELTTDTEPAGNAASRSLEADSAAGETGRVHDLLAWRGERTALHRVTSVTHSGSRLVTYVVNQVDRDGLETRLEVFVEDNLKGAQRRMIELWLDDDGSGFKEIGELALQFSECIAGRDHDGVRRLLHPDFCHRTWKRLSHDVLDTEGFIGNLAIWAEQAGSVSMVSREFPLVTRTGLVGFSDVFAVDTRGAETEWSAAFVLVAKDGKVINFDQFEPDDIDTALARFDELTADEATPEYLTLAERAGPRLDAAQASGDWAALADLIHEDLLGEIRRTGLRETLGREQMVAYARVGTELDMTISPESTDVVVTRGQHLVLAERTVGGDESWVSSFTFVAEVDDDGRLLRFVQFDPDQREEADALLDEWWRESLSPEALAALAVMDGWNDAARAHDRERLERLLHQDLVADAHKPLRFGSGDRESFINAMEAIYEAPDIDIEVPHIPILTERGGVTSVVIRTPDGKEGWADIVVHIVSDGRITRLEMYPEDQMSAAVDRFRELTEPTRAPGNLATQALVAWHTARESGDHSALERLITGDFTVVDHRARAQPIDNLSIEGAIDSIETFADQGRNRKPEIVAWRGARVALSVVSRTENTASGVEFPTVTHVDEAGLIRSLEVFDEDDLDAALRRLEDVFWTDDGSDLKQGGELIRDLTDAIAARDYEGIRQVLHPDFRNHMHKRLSHEVLDTEGFLENMAVWSEMAGSVRMVSREVLKAAPAGFVAFNDIFATDPSGMETEWSAVNVLVIKDGKLINLDEFEADDIDAALARFDELTADQIPNQLRD